VGDEATIGGYVVHPAAAVFPLMDGDEFESLVESICERGVIHPIVVRRGLDADELIDGRNRVLAAEEARKRGAVVDVPVVEWTDGGIGVAEWVWDTNANRRHLNDDGFAMASSAIWPLIAKENEARKAATKFDSEKASKAGKASAAAKAQAKSGSTVTTKSSEPSKRDRKAEHARSTVGQVAAKAGTSMHKARQAIAVQQAIENGELPAATAQEVMAGKKKLRDVVPKKQPARAEPKHRGMKAILNDLREIIGEWMNADHNREVLKDELKTHLERL
jgi:ParB-like chromosome segregation protein Spo0J